MRCRWNVDEVQRRKWKELRLLGLSEKNGGLGFALADCSFASTANKMENNVSFWLGHNECAQHIQNSLIPNGAVIERSARAIHMMLNGF